MQLGSWYAAKSGQVIIFYLTTTRFKGFYCLYLNRRVHTCYLRQLWDDKYDSFVEFDNVENEAHLWVSE
jgi:hypothetical protein